MKLRRVKYMMFALGALVALGIASYSKKLVRSSQVANALEAKAYDKATMSIKVAMANEKRNQISMQIDSQDQGVPILHQSEESIVENESTDGQAQRYLLLQQECRSHYLGNMDDNFNIFQLDRKVKLLYSDKYQFILCEIPKCASSSMKKLLLTTEKLVNITDARQVKSSVAHTLADSMLDLRGLHNRTEINRKMKTYRKLLIVRNPFYRLLSAFRNKLETEYPWSLFFADISRKIHSKYSPQDKSNALATFSEFLKFAANDSQKDRHWEQYNNLCLPCTMHFDFIAHVETIGKDMEIFMRSMNMRNVSFPSNYHASQQTDDEKVNRYMSEVSADIIDDVFDNYRIDFELFGFSKPKLSNTIHR